MRDDEETLDEAIIDALPEESVVSEEDIDTPPVGDGEDGQFDLYDAGLNENGEYSY